MQSTFVLPSDSQASHQSEHMLHSEFSRALSLIEEGHLREGMDILTRITEQSPRYAAAQVALARVISEVGSAEEALRGWIRAEELAPFSQVVRSGVATAARNLFVESDVNGADHERADVGHEAGAREAETTEAISRSGSDDPMLIVPVASFQGWDDNDDSGAPVWHEHPDTVDESDAPPVDEVSPEWDTSFRGDAGDGSSAPDIDLSMDTDSDDIELDRLIGELESARIVPSPDPDAVPAPDLSSDIEDVVSETLARIYATQKQFGEAARVYERLALENPDRAEEFRSKASEMRRQE